MKIVTLVASFFLIVAALFSLGAGPVRYSVVTYPEDPPKGNHELSCTVIRPWVSPPGPNQGPYPVIVWANGWCYNEVYGNSECLEGYKPGLIEWALDGPYIVVAANQWSVQESDVLACAQWIKDQNEEDDSEYQGVVNTGKIGLAGHSQGGGAVIKAGDGPTSEPGEITAVVAMNPYGPAWVDPGNQDGPMMLLGGCEDPTTPPDSYDAIWQAVKNNDQGGINAALEDGDHNDDPWGPSDEKAPDYDFGRYQIVTELWWDFHLNDNKRSGQTLMKLLKKYPWNQECLETDFTNNFDL
jgi:hypothetical protein